MLNKLALAQLIGGGYVMLWTTHHAELNLSDIVSAFMPLVLEFWLCVTQPYPTGL